MKQLFTLFFLLTATVCIAQPLPTVSGVLYIATGAYDADAQAYFTAAAITNTTAKAATNQLIIDLKAHSLWAKMKAIYVLVNQDPAKNKYNLKDPRDLDAAYRLTFTNTGSITHGSTGVVWGSNGYANTHLNGSTDFTANDAHCSYYSQTATAPGGPSFDMGADNGTTAFILSVYDGASAAGYFEANSGFYNTFSPSARDGYYILTRTSATSQVVYRNNVSQGTQTGSNSTNKVNAALYLGCMNASGSPYGSSNRTCSIATWGSGLTATDVSNLTADIQAWANTLGIKIN